MFDHPIRQTLQEQIKPIQSLNSPVRCCYVALLADEDQQRAAREQLLQLCRRLELAPESEGDQLLIQLPGITLKWEALTEFYALTLSRDGCREFPSNEVLDELIPCDWLAALPGQALVAMQVLIDDRDRPQSEIRAMFDSQDLVGVRAYGRGATLYADLRSQEAGINRFYIHDQGLSAHCVARLLQRLCQIETYSMLTLLSEPYTRMANQQLWELERQLNALTEEMASANSDDAELLERILRLTVESERLQAQCNFRFHASSAYVPIVDRRLKELREERLDGFCRLSTALERRMGALVRTLDSLGQRHDSLARRLQRNGELLRTRVQIAMERQNQQQISVMGERVNLQLHLMRMVESISFITITYYVIDFLGSMARGANHYGLGLEYDGIRPFLIPVMMLLVWMVLRLLRRRSLGKESRS